MPKRTPTVGRPLAERPPADARPSRLRSSVTNGRNLFLDGDEQSPWARRVRDLLALHAADLGGPSGLSEAQRSLVRRCAVLETQLEQLEAAMSRGEEVSLDVYTRACGHLRRILETLGIERRAKDVTSLAEYLAGKAGAP